MTRALHALILIASLCAWHGTGFAQNAPVLFGMRELRSGTLGNFRQWIGVLERSAREISLPKDQCDTQRQGCIAQGWEAFLQPSIDQPPCDPQRQGCISREWKSYLRSLIGLPPKDQIDKINRYINQFPYIQDTVNWTKNDYWATPMELMSRGGDCEDYAITKYLSLRMLGFPIDDLRVVIVQDLNLGIPHAVLVVALDGHHMVLDSQIKNVTPANRIYHYRPIYSVNEMGSFLYVR